MGNASRVRCKEYVLRMGMVVIINADQIRAGIRMGVVVLTPVRIFNIVILR